MYFPLFLPLRAGQGKLLFSADYLIQQSCGSTLRFSCSVSVDVHCVLTSACPRSSCTSFGAAPFESRLLVNVWRSWWKWKPSKPSTFLLAVLHIIPTVFGASNAPSGLRQTKDISLLPSTPKVPIPVFVFQVCMPIEYYQRTLCLFSISRIFPAFEIWVQILCDTYNPMSYVINYFCP